MRVMGAAKPGEREGRVGEVFVECVENTGLPGSGSFRQGDDPALWGRRRLPPPQKTMQLAGPKGGGPVYTEWELEVQNGNPGQNGSFGSRVMPRR
jgi:hypothetical protein